MASHGGQPSFLERLDRMDRRWIFLAMFVAVAAPILWVGVTGKTFPEAPTPAVQGAFDAVDRLPPGARVLVSMDFDPASAGELQPMATAIVRHCVLRGHRICAMTLWPAGGPIIDGTMQDVLGDRPDWKYGEQWVNLGYRAGFEGVMKQMNSRVALAYATDVRKTPLGDIPMMKGIEGIADFDLLVSVSAGYAGAKEWVQYSVSPTLTGARPLRFVAGSTGVQTPQLIPYYPNQMAGILGAIKGAAEYEFLVNEAVRKADPNAVVPARFQEAQRRMAPQLFGHVLMVALIVLGNVVFVGLRGREARA
jgi:hypothetical protein